MEEFFNQTEISIFLDVLIASGLTLFVGLEREKAQKAAGIRTNMIVGGFTCLTVSIIQPLIEFIGDYSSMDIINTDPIRVLQAIVLGVSFIGAGTIIKSQDSRTITGLTTAATLLYSSGIGVCVAAKLYLLAILLTVFILIINSIINLITRKFTSFKG